METLAKEYVVPVSIETKSETKISTSDFWEEMEFNRFGIVSLLLVFSVCFGSITVAYTINNPAGLLLGVFSTGLVLISILAIAPMRIILTMGVIAFLTNLSILLLNIL